MKNVVFVTTIKPFVFSMSYSTLCLEDCSCSFWLAAANKYDLFFSKHGYNKWIQTCNLKFEWEHAIFWSMCGWLEM